MGRPDEPNYGQVGEPSVSGLAAGSAAGQPSGTSYSGDNLDQLIGDVLPGWRRAGGAQPFEETELATQASGAQKQQPTGRWKIAVTNGQYTRDIVLNRQDTTRGTPQWMVAEAPKDIPGLGDKAAGPSTVSAPADHRYIITRNADGTMTSSENPNFKGEKDQASQLQPFGDQLLRVAPDGSVSVIASKSSDATKPSTVAFGDTLYSFDGAKVTPLISKPKEPEKPLTEVRNGVTYQWNPGTQSWSESAGLPSERKPATASTNTAAPFITFYDDQGNEVSRQPNPNYQAPTPTQLTPDTVSTNIPLLKPDGSIDWVPNQNRVPVSAAMQELLAQVGVKVNAGEMSMADAKEMLTGTVNVMNARTAAANAQTAEQGNVRAAAGDILTATQQGATTGASLIDQRVQAAQGMLNTVLGMAGQGQRSGNMGGGLMSAPAGLGQQIVGGIQGWTEQLGGGPEVYATAANLVKRADPSNGANPQAQVAYGVLGQMLEKYQQLTGQQHPLVAEQARQQQQQQAGATVPAPTPALPTPAETFSSPPALAQPQYDPRFQPQLPQQEPGTLLPAGVAGTVPPGDPRFKGTFASPPVAPPPVTITIGG